MAVGRGMPGSEASTPGFNSPVTGTLCGYHIAPPGDDLVLGEDHFKLDFPVRDTTDQREVLMFWMAEQLRLPNLYRRYVHLFINGPRRGAIYDDVQQPDQTVLDEFFPDDSDGHLFKIEQLDRGRRQRRTRTSSGEANVLRHYDSGGQHKLARYRWNWRPRASRSANEFGDLFTLIDAVNVPTTTPAYQAGDRSAGRCRELDAHVRLPRSLLVLGRLRQPEPQEHLPLQAASPAAGRNSRGTWMSASASSTIRSTPPLFPATAIQGSMRSRRSRRSAASTGAPSTRHSRHFSAAPASRRISSAV